MSRTPTMAELLRVAIDRRLADVHVSLPAEVRRYDETKQLVDVQPLLKASYEDEEGATVVEPLPVITNVPVVFPGGGGYRVTFPLAVGDTVMLVFSEASLDKWLSQGGTVDPIDPRRHALSDAQAIPGLRPFSNPLTSAPTDRMTVGSDSGLQIHLDGASIRIGHNTANEWAALGETIQGHLNGLKTFLDTLTLPSPAGPAGPPTTPSPSVPTVTSTKVKVAT